MCDFTNRLTKIYVGFLDAVCILCPPIAFRILLPFAAQIIQISKTIPQIRPIIPTVDALANKTPFSRFVVAVVVTYREYHRGPNGTVYTTDPAAPKSTPWNQEQETLSLSCRNEWLFMQANPEDNENEGGFRNLTYPISRAVLRARIWLHQNYELGNNTNNQYILKGDVYEQYERWCTEDPTIARATFGRIIADVFPGINVGLEPRGHVTTNSARHCYKNLRRRNQHTQ